MSLGITAPRMAAPFAAASAIAIGDPALPSITYNVFADLLVDRGGVGAENRLRVNVGSAVMAPGCVHPARRFLLMARSSAAFSSISSAARSSRSPAS